MRRALALGGLVALMLPLESASPVAAQVRIVYPVLATVFDQVFVPQPATIVTLRAVNTSVLATCPVTMEFRRSDGTIVRSSRQELSAGADTSLQWDIGDAETEQRESGALVRLPLDLLNLCFISASVTTEQRAPQSDPCAGRPDGTYCGCDLDPSLDSSRRYACLNGQTIGVAQCSNGCADGQCNDPGGGATPPDV